MSAVLILFSLMGFVVLTFGTAIFVAAEFSLTALERSTVDANARNGGRRDRLVQRAHRTLSFQLSGAQIGISITTLITGYLAEPLIARSLRPVMTAISVPGHWVDGTALVLALLIATSVSMVFGELVAQYLIGRARRRAESAMHALAQNAGRFFTLRRSAEFGTQLRLHRSLKDPRTCGRG